MIKKQTLTGPILLLPALLTLAACQSMQTSVAPATETPSTSLAAADKNNAVSKTYPYLPIDVIASTEATGSSELVDNDAVEAEYLLSKNGTPNHDQIVAQEIQQEVEIALNQEANAWHRLQQGMRMNPVMNKRIQAQMDWYLSHRAYLDRVMQRAKPVLPFILDELEKKNLPTELALLPIVESAYQTFAYSHGRASGMWQIIPSTGRILGLKQNWWYDGRRDILESTRAATDYLQSLSKQFDQDWELALASYNAGPGRVRSAIRYNKKKSRKTDFWSLTKLRKETKDYVPKLLALKEIFENPENYGIDLLHIEDKHGYEIVELDSQIDLALAADMAGISTEELYQLNPAFNRWATAPEGPHRLLLPKENVAQFKSELAELPKSKRINWIRHKIRQGDTLSQLALKYRTTTTLIKNVNNIRNSQIREGKYLLIPTATKSLNQYSLSKSARVSKIQNTSRKGNKVTYTVKSGDSFWSISRKYGVNTRSLAKWNGMSPIDTLKIGQKLVVWTSSSQAKVQPVSLMDTSPQNKMHALRYTVRKGDSLSRIADKFNIRVADIKKWNKVGKYLQPGQKLKLYVDITRQSG